MIIAARPRDLFHRSAVLKRVVDGDTLVLNIDLGFGTYKKQKVRIPRVDTPESNRFPEKPAGEYVEKLLSKLIRPGDRCDIVSLEYETDSFGRCIAEVWFNDWNLSTWLLKERLAWATDERGKIIGERDIHKLGGIPKSIRDEVADYDSDK